ncbi:MAG: GIY-YIG nuclease family protein [Candidatus Omnitrophica bacterium]|nr:GIY-YIG nuclease family protein [Candidatus Omnitrophota bacterium]
MSFWVYVLKSEKDGRHYVGSGADVDERLHRHNRGDYRYTKGHRPWVVIYREEFASRSEAVRRERFLKTGVGRKELKEKLVTL